MSGQRITRETLRECIDRAAERPGQGTSQTDIYAGGAMQSSLRSWFEQPTVRHGERSWPTYGNVLALLDEIEQLRSALAAVEWRGSATTAKCPACGLVMNVAYINASIGHAPHCELAAAPYAAPASTGAADR